MKTTLKHYGVRCWKNYTVTRRTNNKMEYYKETDDYKLPHRENE